MVALKRVLPVLALAVLAMPTGVEAQSTGDSVRVATVTGWQHGRFVSWEPNGVTIQDVLGDRHELPLPESGEIDVWKPRNLALDLLLGAVGGFALWAALYDEDRAWTDSRWGDAAIGAAGTTVIALGFHAIWPGRWSGTRHPDRRP